MHPAVSFENATVHTMRGDAALPDRTVLVRGDRIVTIAPSAQFASPPDALRIDARGCHLLPGLADMHVHLMPFGVGEGPGMAPDDDAAMARGAEYLRVLLLHGVTLVRNMAGTPLHLRLRDAVADGRIAGPRIHTTGPVLETRFTFPQLAAFGTLVRTPEEARATVVAQHRQGYDSVKVYNDLDAPVYDEIVATCRELGMKVVGHVAYAKGLHGALAARQDSIEHFRSYDFALDTRGVADPARFVGWLHTTPERIREVAERTAEAGTWNVPTLVVERAMTAPRETDDAPKDGRPAWLPGWLAQEMRDDDLALLMRPEYLAAIEQGQYRRLQLLHALDRAGAPLMAGSDCPGCGLVPGRSLHEELELYLEAGLSPLRALRAATLDAARFLGRDDELGSVEVGKLADLLLLQGDPTQGLQALRQPVGVMTAGLWRPMDELAASLVASACGR